MLDPLRSLPVSGDPPRRLLRLIAVLVLITVLGGTMLSDAQARQPPAVTGADTTGNAEPAESVPSSAWLLPFDDLREGEPVAWTIVLCSVVGVTLIVQGFLRVRKQAMMPPESLRQIRELIEQRRFTELLTFTDSDDSFVSRALNPALRRAPNIAEMREGLETGVANETSRQHRRLEVIHILANIGPLLGLLGTVLGIMKAFLEIRRAGGAAEVGNLAGGISMALGTTMLGLILAIVCMSSYGILRNKADQLTQEGATEAEDLLRLVRASARAATVVPAAAVATPAPATARPPVPMTRDPHAAAPPFAAEAAH